MMMVLVVVMVVANVALLSHPTRVSRPGREHDEVHPPVECRTSFRQESQRSVESSSALGRCQSWRVALSQQVLVA